MATLITPEQAKIFATLALNGLQREYPNHISHLLNNSSDVASPKTLHPAFYGCYDVHSAVHGHWLIIRVLRLFPKHELTSEIRRVLNENLTKENIETEIAYFKAPNRRTFERPYGWAWILKLQAEIEEFNKENVGDSNGATWGNSLRPLADYIVDQFMDFLKKEKYPNRVGAHGNTAFAIYLTIDYATVAKNLALLTLLHQSIQSFYESDAEMHHVARLEPNHSDFLSPVLMVAALISRGQSPQQFAKWFSSYFPSLPHNLLRPVHVVDKADPLMIHFDGLNLSRAWCLQQIAKKLSAAANQDIGFANVTIGGLVRDTLSGMFEDRVNIIKESAKAHRTEGLENVLSGEYGGEHWLGTFAMLALTD